MSEDTLTVSAAEFDASPAAVYEASKKAPVTVLDGEGRPSMTVIGGELTDHNAMVDDRGAPLMVALPAESLRMVLHRLKHVGAQRDDLQRRMTKKVETSLGRCVRAFHVKFGHPVNTVPRVPDEADVRFRLSLIAEEFFELLHAALRTDDLHFFEDAEQRIRAAINGAYPYQRAAVVVDLPEFIDATVDLDYVVEGTRAVFGVDAAPVLAEVQRANMSKDAVYVEEKDGTHVKGSKVKPRKPRDWRGPDVAGVLRAQGWDGFDGRRTR